MPVVVAEFDDIHLGIFRYPSKGPIASIPVDNVKYARVPGLFLHQEGAQVTVIHL
jgi:hypothetical protein